MARLAARIWFWSLTILPFTTIITFVITLVVCSQVPHMSSGRTFPEISFLGTGSAYYYFVSGFVILAVQFLLVLIGRLQYLLQSQSIIHHIILYVIHAIPLLSMVFLLIMAIVSLDVNPYVHGVSATLLFVFLLCYCFSHTFVVFYLFNRRSKTPQHSNIVWPMWFLFCSILLSQSFNIWQRTGHGIPQYIAVGMPFLYILGFVPQFWWQAKLKRQKVVLSPQVPDVSETLL